MRWKSLWYGIPFVVSVIFPQTYVLKVKEGSADSSVIHPILRQSTSAVRSARTAPPSFSSQPFSASGRTGTTSFPWHRYAIVRFSQEIPEAVVRSVMNQAAVEYFQPVVRYSVRSIPNDSAFGSQWNLQQIGITSLWNSGAIDLTLPPSVIGVIDTGIDDDHPDLRNVIAFNAGERGDGKESNGVDDDGNGFVDDWKGYDFVDFETEDIGDWNMQDNDPDDEHGHGTAVAGIIGAQSNNSVGSAGVTIARLLPLRAFGKNGNGNDIDIAAAVVYAADNGAEVINMSFGDIVRSSILHDAIRYAHSKNIVLVASSGNDGSEFPHYPSDLNEVMSIGSSNQLNRRSFFSAYGPGLDLVAPGEGIVTTLPGGKYTDQFSGTSAAAPHVSGVSALLLSLEKRKRLQNQPGIVFTNDEIRGLLMNTAVDVEGAGWDKFTGAGVVNALAATAGSGSEATIHSPGLDDILSTNGTPVIVSAKSPYLASVRLQIGRGDQPSEWTDLKVLNNRILVRDTIIFLALNSFIDGVYVLKLIVKNSKGNDLVALQRIQIAHSPPTVTSFRFRDSVIIGTEFTGLIEARTDRLTDGYLYYRKKGTVNFQSIRSLGTLRNHHFFLGRNIITPGEKFEFYTVFSENSDTGRQVRFPTTISAGFELFEIEHPITSLSTVGFTQKSFSLPKGFLLNSTTHIGGVPHVVLNEYTRDNDFGKTKAFGFIAGAFVAQDSAARSWVPRGFARLNGQTPSVLVQDRGVSNLFRVDTAGKRFFSAVIWSDSTDVWASQIVDLNGDGKDEIIARSSSEYLIYADLGNAAYGIVDHLPNPTPPLSNEARNQFGPPRTIVGDFTNSGKKEIIFADHDGDLLMYRQQSSQSLDFTLAAVDTSDLFSTSDFIAAGDFTGDGIQDIVVAGHSSIDANDDREYNVPVWTVRVFSHVPSAGPGSVTKIWEYHFAGVKGGSRYDNGIAAGKLRMTDDRDMLFLSFNPFLYVFAWDAVQKTFVSRWTHSSQSNSVIVSDFDGDGAADIGFHTNNRTEFWSVADPTVTTPPYGLYAVPLSASSIRLRWNTSVPTTKIYRGTALDSLFAIQTLSNQREWTDTLLTTGIKYYYSVASVSTAESERTPVVSAVPHLPATITAIRQLSTDQLMVTVSFDIRSDLALSARFAVDTTIFSSSALWTSARTLLVTLPRTIDSGSHVIRIVWLTDAEGLEGDTTASFTFTAGMVSVQKFFVRSISRHSPNSIIVEFNEIPVGETARNIAYYAVKNSIRTFTVAGVDSLSPTTVLLRCVEQNLFSIALRLEVKVSRQVRSISGRALDTDRDQTLSIDQPISSISDIVVFPNPVRSSEKISFVHLPENCRITIFASTGEIIKVFDRMTTREGISWDLRDHRGRVVSTGIYLYRVEQLNDQHQSQNTTLGKFAVIR